MAGQIYVFDPFVHEHRRQDVLGGGVRYDAVNRYAQQKNKEDRDDFLQGEHIERSHDYIDACQAEYPSEGNDDAFNPGIGEQFDLDRFIIFGMVF